MKPWRPWAAGTSNTASVLSSKLGLAVLGYVLFLGALLLLLRFVGEAFWLTALALYVPRLLWFAPLSFLAPLVLWRGPRVLSVVLLGATLLAAMPLLGVELRSHTVQAAASGDLRVMTYNANQCRDGFDAMVSLAVDSGADLVLMQEVCSNAQYVVERLRQAFQVARLDGEFLLASRYAVSSARLGASARPGIAPRHARYEVVGPFGPLTVYNIHPISPRPGWIALARALRAGLSRPTHLLTELPAIVDANSLRRARELALAMDSARADRGPVLIAGDTNLPVLSPLLASELAGFRDGFPSRGRGLGNTYPGILPFLRIDRVLTSESLCFSSIQVACRHSRDHLCVLAGVAPCAEP